MSNPKVTIRELRLNFRAVKRKMEEHGTVIVTDNGVPAYMLMPLPEQKQDTATQPDYYARLQEQQPLSPRATRELHEENRG